MQDDVIRFKSAILDMLISSKSRHQRDVIRVKSRHQG